MARAGGSLRHVASRSISLVAHWLTLRVGLALVAGLAGGASTPSSPSDPATPVLSFLDPQGPVAAAQRAHLLDVVLILLIVIVPVLVVTPFLVWRYRLGGAARYTPRWAFSRPLELVIWGVPVAVVGVLAVWLWRQAEALDPYAPLASAAPPLEVEIVGYDWKWLFIYPDLQIASIGTFAFPADRPLAIELTSDTVMLSFFIPALGSQIYAMPGMVTRLHLLADAPGRFRGKNTQYNGRGFHKQKFTARAMPPADFRSWAADVQANGIPMSGTVYRAIRQRSTLDGLHQALSADRAERGPLSFTDVPPDLFDRVVGAYTGGSPAMTQSGADGGGSAEAVDGQRG